MAAIVAAVSDIHSNSKVAVCPPAITDDDGGTYRASKAQLWLWSNWQDYWQAVKQKVGKGRWRKKLYLVIIGEISDGDHHDTTQIISRNEATQLKIALAVLRPALDLKPDYIFILRGTEAHSKPAAAFDEMVARDIGAVPEREPKADDPGVYSWWWLPLEVESVLFDITHHGRAGYRYWTKANSANALAVELMAQYAEQGRQPPDVALRSHVHKVYDTYDNYPIRVIGTPSWQLQTAYSHRIAPGQLLPIGGLIITCDDGAYEVEKKIYQPEMRDTWRASKD